MHTVSGCCCPTSSEILVVGRCAAPPLAVSIDSPRRHEPSHFACFLLSTPPYLPPPYLHAVAIYTEATRTNLQVLLLPPVLNKALFELQLRVTPQ
ncbi:hypothetical protein IAQ61_007537 [Plenodomus lingam]|uniref:uncharacterized protein n=1 Tax=Leptosphaeria maculans TaxID=5022 RepID=UPI00332D58EF|nr:hypothetical protein IAQ61_007537 [Plenodomus lingam]